MSPLGRCRRSPVRPGRQVPPCPGVSNECRVNSWMREKRERGAVLKRVTVVGSMKSLLRAARQVTSLVFAGALFVHALPAAAQTDEQRASARSLATEGATAFNEARWKEAVDLFTRAESLVHAPPHLLFLARAHTKLGQFVKAREAYLKIVKETLAPNAPRAFRDAQVSAEQELKEIEPRIGSLT